MTINAPGGDPAAALRAGRRGAGRPLREAARHGPERRAEGVHGARQLHLPARADDAADHRHLRVLPRERAEVEHDLDLRLPHPREGLLGRAGGRLHALQRDRLRRGGARARASKIDEFAPRLAFFFNCHNNVFQEIAKFRAVRRMWAKIVERALRGARTPNSMKIRFHTQTGGVTLQAQQPEVNIIRVALQGFAAVCGGTQSLHTNGFDEALALPTERSARIALRTQQVLAHESGAADTVDPFAGSYFVESLTDEIEARAWELMDKVEELGGSVEALEFMQREIEESALSYHERYKSGQDIIVGVNKYVTDQVDDVDILQVDPEAEQRQLDAARRPSRSAATRPRSSAKLEALRDVARGDGNLLHPIRAALAADASIGEVCGAMRDVFGEYKGGAFF